MFPSFWTIRAGIVLLMLSSTVKTDMTPVEVYDALSSRLDTVSFDIRLFRKSIARSDTRMDGFENKLEDINRQIQTFTGMKSTNQNKSNGIISLEVKRQVKLVQKAFAVEKKLLREMGEQFENRWKDVNGVGQRLNSLNKSCEELRTNTRNIEASTLKRIKNIEKKIESVQTSVIKGQKGEQGQKGSSGSHGKAGTPGREGPRGFPGPAGPPGRPGVPGILGNDGLPGMKGEKGDQGSVQTSVIKGQKGEQGQKGSSGSHGKAGTPGREGPRGFSGPVGPPGRPGMKGEKGDQGLPGQNDDRRVFHPQPSRSWSDYRDRRRNPDYGFG